jgi:hypothetical protein
VSLGAPFAIATTYWWNMPTVGDSPTTLAIGGDVEVTPPGLAPFQFWISRPNGGLAAGDDRLAINWLDTPNAPPCDPSYSRPGDVPCDDAATLSPGTWTEVADGLSWHLNVLGFQDPGNPPGTYTKDVLVPEDTAALVAPVMATLTVDTNTTSTTLQSAGASTRYGDPVQLTATVSPAPSTAGTAAFQDGGQAIAGCAAQPVDPSTGTATCTTSSLRAGPHTITAVYSGAFGFAGSTSSPLTQTVTPAPLTVNAPDATAAYGSVPSSFKATYAGLLNGDTAPATPASCTTTASNSSAPGSYPITCSGASDPDYSITYGPAGTLTVTRAPTAMRVAPASRSLLSITFSATLTRPDTGVPLSGKTVAFSVAGQKVCSAATNSSGIASCKVTGLVIGSGSYTASFAGDTLYVSSTGNGNL